MATSAESDPQIVKSDQQWRDQLSANEYAVLRRGATEPPHSGEYVSTDTIGVYECRACGAELFRSETKFASHCGWPSFYDPRDTDAVILREDRSMGMVRVEVLCASCHGHLGHVFSGEGYDTPTDQRFCMNSIAIAVASEPPRISICVIRSGATNTASPVSIPIVASPNP